MCHSVNAHGPIVLLTLTSAFPSCCALSLVEFPRSEVVNFLCAVCPWCVGRSTRLSNIKLEVEELLFCLCLDWWKKKNKVGVLAPFSFSLLQLSTGVLCEFIVAQTKANQLWSQGRRMKYMLWWPLCLKLVGGRAR